MKNAAELQTNSNMTKIIHTSRFGDIEVDENKLITMTSPLLGFPEDRLFALLPHSSNAPFFWLQSTDTPELAFLVISPELVHPDFRPEINPTVRKELNIPGEVDLEFMVILTIPHGKPQEMTANLLGPVVYNAEKRLAKQVVLDPKIYDPCWPVPLG